MRGARVVGRDPSSLELLRHASRRGLPMMTVLTLLIAVADAGLALDLLAHALRMPFAFVTIIAAIMALAVVAGAYLAGSLVRNGHALVALMPASLPLGVVLLMAWLRLNTSSFVAADVRFGSSTAPAANGPTQAQVALAVGLAAFVLGSACAAAADGWLNGHLGLAVFKQQQAEHRAKDADRRTHEASVVRIADEHARQVLHARRSDVRLEDTICGLEARAAELKQVFRRAAANAIGDPQAATAALIPASPSRAHAVRALWRPNTWLREPTQHTPSTPKDA